MEKDIKVITSDQITEAVFNLCNQANIYIPKDIYNAILESYHKEESPRSKYILWQILENVRLASTSRRPICQDTGMVVAFVEIGQNAYIDGDLLEVAINKGVEKSYRENCFRKSIVDEPIFSRTNTGNNTPAIIHTKIVSGNAIKIEISVKGCGSENMSAARMLKPSSGVEGIIDFVLETVKNAGANPCPPIRLGIGIGGTLEHSALLSKKALLKPIRSEDFLLNLCYAGIQATKVSMRNATDAYFPNTPSVQNIPSDVELWNPTAYSDKIAKLELEILKKVNKLNIGPSGLGGSTTVFGVNILSYPTHIAALPVTVNINCHASRHASAKIHESKIEYNFDNFQYDFASVSESNDKVKILNTDDIEGIRALKIGDIVHLNGYIYTARDAAHKKLVECINKGEDFPIDIKDKIIYYVGPCPPKENEIIGPSGPTTSTRMDKYAPILMEYGLLGSIGKGQRLETVVKSIKENKSIYFCATGGAACLLQEKIKEAQVVAYPELGPEAIYKLKIENFPVIAAIDTDGNNIFS